MQNMPNEFSIVVADSLKYYVYILIDPRDNKIFYVGKGSRNRLFQHVNEAESTNAESDKLDIIRAIKESGNKVKYYIVRHGLETSAEALLVESVMIDFLTFRDFGFIAKISNIQAGHHQWDKGLKTVEEIEEIYDCPLVERKHKLLCVNINSTYKKERNIYEATRKSWRVNKFKADKADFVVGEYHGVIRAVFEVNEKGWQLQHGGIISDVGKAKRRYFFEGRYVEDKDILDRYLNKRLSEKKKGQRNPIWYLY